MRVAANPVRPGDSGGPLLDAGRPRARRDRLGRQTDGAARPAGGPDDAGLRPACPALARYQPAEPPGPRCGRALAAVGADDAGGPGARAVGAIRCRRGGRGWDQRPHVALLRRPSASRRRPRPPVPRRDDARGGRRGPPGGRRARRVPSGGLLPGGLLARPPPARPRRPRAGPPPCSPRPRPAARTAGWGRYGAGPGARRARPATMPRRPRWRRSSTTTPASAPALYLLGIVRLAQGREDEARALAVRLAAARAGPTRSGCPSRRGPAPGAGAPSLALRRSGGGRWPEGIAARDGVAAPGRDAPIWLPKNGVNRRTGGRGRLPAMPPLLPLVPYAERHARLGAVLDRRRRLRRRRRGLGPRRSSTTSASAATRRCWTCTERFDGVRPERCSCPSARSTRRSTPSTLRSARRWSRRRPTSAGSTSTRCRPRGPTTTATASRSASGCRPSSGPGSTCRRGRRRCRRA